MKPNQYNVRVYGIWINSHKKVLVTDELRGSYPMTKFPGGGHEFGEGLSDGLRREWQEELQLDIEVGELFYINDFLQLSAFNPKDQLLSVYYFVTASESVEVPLASKPLDFPPGVTDAQTFRWISLENLSEADFTFPVDRVVARKLLGFG
jgi:ADP-ribose pyrophosphatase YjhB (NUDIX family)